jgi:uncharacterized protein YabN with tetrapyrrole methylase and pyrophosphatase domain
MSIKRLEKIIETCREDIAKMEIDLSSKKSFLQGLQEALKIYPKDGVSETQSETLLRHGSDMAKARDFLTTHGKPAHVSEIVVGIGKENTKENRVSLAGSLANYARKEDIFKKTAPNTFTLVNFKNFKQVSETVGQRTQEIPANFGVDYLHEPNNNDDDVPF